jgi:hypothetical protein
VFVIECGLNLIELVLETLLSCSRDGLMERGLNIDFHRVFQHFLILQRTHWQYAEHFKYRLALELLLARASFLCQPGDLSLDAHSGRRIKPS